MTTRHFMSSWWSSVWNKRRLVARKKQFPSPTTRRRKHWSCRSCGNRLKAWASVLQSAIQYVAGDGIAYFSTSSFTSSAASWTSRKSRHAVSLAETDWKKASARSSKPSLHLIQNLTPESEDHHLNWNRTTQIHLHHQGWSLNHRHREKGLQHFLPSTKSDDWHW